MKHNNQSPRSASNRINPEQMLGALFRDSALPIFLIEEHGSSFRIADLNPAYDRMTEGRASTWIGLRIEDVFPPEVIPGITAHYRRCIQANEPIAYEEFFPVHDREAWWLTRLVPQIGPDGNFVIGISYEITEMIHTRKMLEKSESLHRALIASMEEGVLVTDRTAGLLACNSRILEIMETTEQALRNQGSGRSFVAVVDIDDNPIKPEDFPTPKTMRTGLPVRNQILGLIRADQTRKWVSVSCNPVQTTRDDGLPDIVLSTTHELTDRIEEEKQIHALNQQLQTSVEDLKEANQELESFSYSVSHDLRVPLRAIDGFSRILELEYGQTFDDEAKRLLSVIRDSTARMTRLIDDLLAFSRLGRLELNVSEQPLSLSELIKDVWKSLDMTRSGKTYSFGADELPSLRFDPSMMRQALENLLGNAIKYSRNREAPEIQIAYSLIDGQHQIRVKDNGEGFDMRYQHRLFGIFQRLHTDAEFEGTGVGLAIVRRIIQRHGGSIDGSSEPGKGAIFTITLPGQG